MSCSLAQAAPSAGDKANDQQAQDSHQLLDIPQPPEHYFLGNISDVDPAFLGASFQRLAKIYGSIFKLNLLNREAIVISSHELAAECSDDKRFEKHVKGPQEYVRAFLKNGLFTSYPDEEEWWMAHRILIPAFGPIPIRKMFPQMMDIVSQMVLRWDRLGEHHVISCSDDFTRMAFDTIGLCAFNYRFNDFYTQHIHPFATQMADILLACGMKAARPAIVDWFHFADNQKFKENIDECWKLCDEIVADRKAHPKPEVNDLLNIMLSVEDPQTKRKLSDENIRYQMATFLVAGHETTSGTMSFLLHNLLTNPSTLQKCYAEVDEVVGDRALELSHLRNLKYIEAVIRETLRVMGPINVTSRRAKQETVIGGRYKVRPDQTLTLNLLGVHHDRAVYGDDADEFKPERFLNGGWEKLPANAWKPFGTGMRACIGRALAEQEILIAAALIFQRFNIEMADPSYQLRVKSTLTVKPENFTIKVRRRPGKPDMVGIPGAPASASRQEPMMERTTQITEAVTSHPLTILYGGNSGTCKAFAEDIQSSGRDFGFEGTVKGLDTATEALPADQPVVIITASYEGEPPENAKQFVAWLEHNQDKPKRLDGVKYALFGVGNSEWHSTLHRIPKLVEHLLSQMGAERILPSGFVDVKEDLVGPFEDWKEALFPKLRETTGVQTAVNKQQIRVDMKAPRIYKTLTGQGPSEATVLLNKELASKCESVPRKMHMEVQLPPGTEYQTGDYLVILPLNPNQDVKRVMKRFGLHPDDIVKVSGTTKTHLVDKEMTVFELLKTRVELAMPASQRQVEALANESTDNARAKLEQLAAKEQHRLVALAKRTSVLDLLEDFPSCKLSFASYLDMLPPLAARQYSISSSMIQQPVSLPASGDLHSDQGVVASVTYDVYEGPAKCGKDRHFYGVATNYMASLQPGEKLRCFVRPTNAGFHLSANPEIPVIMMATGTGIAPMRGFIQERAAIKAGARQRLGPAILYFGVRDHERDYIYRDELAAWEQDGVVEVRMAFSKNCPAGQDPQRVPDRLWKDRDEVRQLFMDGAKIFVCGSASGLGRSSADMCMKIWREKQPEKTQEDAEKWLREQREERFVADVFG